MARRIKLKVEFDDAQEILQALTDESLYSPDLLYRVFTREPGFDVREIMRRGTDRTSGGSDEGYNLHESLDNRRKERGRPLKPTEYIWATTEDGLGDELLEARTKLGPDNIYVSVYDRARMFCLDDNVCFEFIDKRRKRRALIALIQLEY